MENVWACLLLKLISALSWIETRHKRRHCQWENSFTNINYIYKKNQWKKKQWNWRSEKMSKAVEENK